LNADAFVIANAEVVLGLWVALLGRFPAPLKGFTHVCLDTLTAAVAAPEVVLCFGASFFRSTGIPPNGLFAILSDTQPKLVAYA
jgi:hypothetical protein